MHRLLLVALALFTAGALRAEPVMLADTDQRAITSAKIGQRYDLLIKLPAEYATSGKSYPVLYVLDGWHFPMMAALSENSVYSKRLPPLIIVNISHGDKDYMKLRARDFTPTRTDREATSGGAAAFLDFLEHEIIPLVDRTYRTVPTDRGLLGHSYGGLFALYVLEERPALFQRVVAASPVAAWDHDLLIKSAATKLQHLPSPIRLDLSAGTDQDVNEMTQAFAAELDRLKPANLDYRCTLFPGENHNSVRFASFPQGLYWVYRP